MYAPLKHKSTRSLLKVKAETSIQGASAPGTRGDMRVVMTSLNVLWLCLIQGLGLLSCVHSVESSEMMRVGFPHVLVKREGLDTVGFSSLSPEWEGLPASTSAG